MATRRFSFTQGEYYHCFNRGVEKRNIFKSKEDKVRFQKLLYLCNGERALDLRELPVGPAYNIDVGRRLVDIGAYALMSNHYHLLLRERIKNGISNFMLKLGTSHSMYFNLTNDRSGRLFEGTFKAVHANEDRYLKYLFAYIHLNPSALINGELSKGDGKEKEVLKRLEKYDFSSYQDHIGIGRRLESKILNLQAFPKYFSNISDYEEEMLNWLTYDISEG